MTTTRPTGSPVVTDATGRLSLRRRRTRRQRLFLAGGVSLALLLVAALGWLVLGSSVLGVRTVEVQGTQIATADQVKALVGVPPGTPLARVDLAAVADRVSGLPPVASVSVTRQWPSTLLVRVVERTPMFALETPGGYWIADEHGVIFASAAEAPKALAVARVPSGDPRLVRDLGTVLRALPESLLKRVKVLVANTPDSISLELSDGDTIVWGSAEQSELKAQVVVALMRRNATVYDVSSPSNPTTR